MHDPNNPAYFSLDERTVNKIKARNPTLSDATFHTVRDQRPYLIVNSCIVAPNNVLPVAELHLADFHYTPLYLGSPFAKSITYHPKSADTVSKWIGGGFIEPFAFGSSVDVQAFAPTQETDSLDESTVIVQQPEKPFTLVEAAGTSSAAFVSTLVSWIKSITAPLERYWPLTDSDEQVTDTFCFGDGGHLDNYGLIALLQRKVENIIVFINSMTKLNLAYDPTVPPGEYDIDYSLGPLFGYPATGMQYNQVFDQRDFIKLIHELQQAKREGRTIMATTDLTVQANSWWGVEGGWQVKICWVYNDRVTKWEKQLSPEIQQAIEQGNRGPQTSDQINKDAWPAFDETGWDWDAWSTFDDMSEEEWHLFVKELEAYWQSLEESSTKFWKEIEDEWDKEWKKAGDEWNKEWKKVENELGKDWKEVEKELEQGWQQAEEEFEKEWQNLVEMGNDIWNAFEQSKPEGQTKPDEEPKANYQSSGNNNPLENFPNYNTIGQNSWSIVRLTKPQINLLAHLSCWNITDNAETFRQLLS